MYKAISASAGLCLVIFFLIIALLLVFALVVIIDFLVRYILSLFKEEGNTNDAMD